MSRVRTAVLPVPNALPARAVLLAALLLTLLPLLAAAQSSHRIARSGFFGSFGLGVGQDRFSVTPAPGTEVVTSEGAGAAVIRLGGSLSQRFALSADLFGAVPDNAVEDDGTAAFLATGTWFPGGGNFLVRGGLGSIRTEETVSTALSTTTSALAVQVGIGYDIRISRNKAIALTLDVIQGTNADYVGGRGRRRLALFNAAFSVY